MSASNNVCQFFIQGKCKFGEKCRNLHPGTRANAFNSLTGRPSLSNNQYGQQRQQQHPKSVSMGYNRFALLSDDSSLSTWHGSSSNGSSNRSGGNIFNISNKRSASDVTSLNPFLAQQQQQLEDMSEDDVPNVENIKSILHSDAMDLSSCSTLWPLTSYSPIGGTSMFPEFEDISAEEIRWDCYIANSNNKIQEHTSRLQKLMMTRKSLISQLSVIKREDLTNRLMSVKDQLLSTAISGIQNPFPQSSDKPLIVVSSPSSQPSTNASTKPVTTSVPSVKHSLQTDPATTSSSGGTTLKKSSSLTKEDMDAYKATKFILGKIPTLAPPPELC